jgi:hypothetical protein
MPTRVPTNRFAGVAGVCVWRKSDLRLGLILIVKAFCLSSLLAVVFGGMTAHAQEAWKAFEDGRFSWNTSGPLIDVGPGKDATDPHVSIKDPTVVFHDGGWHLFATVRTKSGRVDIEYLRFTDWALANRATRHVLALHDQYYCAPQVFFFRPHRKWYLV